ncbi:hypothetical protein [Streptosporangium sp. NPDC051022]|uniref:hypothetical protein n=1 Tax=Streptosporangium sp. NPDC051022 TaxID=3155752 RepID=UPI003413A0C2
MSTTPTPISADDVAELFTGSDNDLCEDLNAWPGLTSKGNVVFIKMTPAIDGEADKNAVTHFRAVVAPVTDEALQYGPLEEPIITAKGEVYIPYPEGGGVFLTPEEAYAQSAVFAAAAGLAEKARRSAAPDED